MTLIGNNREQMNASNSDAGTRCCAMPIPPILLCPHQPCCPHHSSPSSNGGASKLDSAYPHTFSKSGLIFGPAGSIPSNGEVDGLQRRRSTERYALNRTPRSQTSDAIAPNMTTATTMIPNPSTRPSMKQSSVKSKLDGRGPWTSKFELLCGLSLWSNGNAVLLCLHNSLRDQDFWLSFGDSGPMILSKSSLQTVFERRSWLKGSGSLRYASSVSGVNFAIHIRCGSDVCGVLLDMMNGEYMVEKWA